jgi:hypothetical protein
LSALHDWLAGVDPSLLSGDDTFPGRGAGYGAGARGTSAMGNSGQGMDGALPYARVTTTGVALPALDAAPSSVGGSDDEDSASLSDTSPEVSLGPRRSPRG